MGDRPILSLVSDPVGDEDTLARLRELILMVESGEILGIAYVALHKGNGYSGDVTGTAKDRPVYALGLAHILEEAISQLIK